MEVQCWGYWNQTLVIAGPLRLATNVVPVSVQRCGAVRYQVNSNHFTTGVPKLTGRWVANMLLCAIDFYSPGKNPWEEGGQPANKHTH